MKAELVAITQPVVKTENGERFLTAEELIVYCARVSNPNNQLNLGGSEKLIRYLLEHGHWSPFEMAEMTVEIQTSRAIMAQILRHHSFRFQEFCISGDSLITLQFKDGSAYKRKIEDLYKRKLEGRLARYIRVYEEDSKKFVKVNLIDVYKTGIKDIFEFELYNGKKIKCTKDHKVLTRNGFETFEKALGMSKHGNMWTFQNDDTFIACNGIKLFETKEWLEKTKKESIENGKGIFHFQYMTGMSNPWVRKKLKLHGLQYTRKEVASFKDVWNKGKSGYSTGKRSNETIQKMKNSAKKGSDSNLWKGGSNRSDRLKIADWCNSIRKQLLNSCGYKCKNCDSSKSLEIHHIKTVSEYPELAYDINNLEVLCRDCHKKHHNTNGDIKKWREKSKGNTLTVEWSKVKYVKYIGKEMTYDLEVGHYSHNYVANGIVVHNSLRYSTASEFENIQIRAKHVDGNRQGSGEVDPTMTYMANVNAKQQFQLYNHFVGGAYLDGDGNNVQAAPECARFLLPLATTTTAYMKGNIRSWITYFVQRLDPHSQKEHRELAEEIYKIFESQFPVIGNLIKGAKTKFVFAGDKT